MIRNTLDLVAETFAAQAALMQLRMKTPRSVPAFTPESEETTFQSRIFHTDPSEQPK